VALVEKNKSTIVREKLMMETLVRETLVKLAMRNTSLIPQTKVKMVAQKKGKTRTNVDGG